MFYLPGRRTSLQGHLVMTKNPGRVVPADGGGPNAPSHPISAASLQQEQGGRVPWGQTGPPHAYGACPGQSREAWVWLPPDGVPCLTLPAEGRSLAKSNFVMQRILFAPTVAD